MTGLFNEKTPLRRKNSTLSVTFGQGHHCFYTHWEKIRMTAVEIEIYEADVSSCQHSSRLRLAVTLIMAMKRWKPWYSLHGPSPGNKLTCHYAYVLLRWYMSWYPLWWSSWFAKVRWPGGLLGFAYPWLSPKAEEEITSNDRYVVELSRTSHNYVLLNVDYDYLRRKRVRVVRHSVLWDMYARGSCRTMDG